MLKRHKSNLAKTAIWLLKRADSYDHVNEDVDLEFNMGSYGKPLRTRDSPRDEISDVRPGEARECGTSCCFAGAGPHALQNVRRLRGQDVNYSWDAYVKATYGVLEFAPDNIWNFLFHPSWPDDLFEAAARALVFLTKGVPEIGDYKGALGDKFDGRYCRGRTDETLIRQLKKFV